MSSTTATPHVGDVGTLYKGKIQDNGVPFDPTAALEKKLIFRPPNGIAFVRVASVTTDGTDWYLNYTIVQADVDAGWHAAGAHFWQGYVKADSGHFWWTTVDSFNCATNLTQAV